ncbi:MAG TPA: hypothetical protein VFC99_20685 [Acidimicrobiia bacterium]|nr:hypothetical protein [Acidimicrobiia bacterium]
MRIDRVLAAAGAALMVAGGAAWASTPAGASFLPSGGADARIVWSSSRPQPAPINESNGELGLWTVDPATVQCTSGTNPCTAWSQGDIQELTGFDAQHCANGNDDDQPFFSPDGAKVVYRTDCNGANHAIWKVVLGNGVQQGTPLTTDGADDSWPSYAPDDHTVIFERTNGHEQLWKVDENNLGAGPSLVFGDPNADALNPVYDPQDQTKIVFVSRTGAHDEIVMLDTAANTLTDLSRISAGETGCTTPVGTPFGASCSTPTSWNDDKPDIASDAGRIVFSSTRPLVVGGAVQTKPQLWSFLFNGTNPMTIFGGSAGTNGTGFADTNPAYSPQNDNVVFQRTTGAGDIESFSMGVSNENRGSGPPTDNSYITGAAPRDITPNWGSQPGNPVLPEVPYAILIPGAGLLLAGGTIAIRRRRSPGAAVAAARDRLTG